ncbi:MAG: dTDP-glucose 4,6-dehydratase [bacterium]|jgi:dTDP-glucose 4,6-dehydratase
MSSKSILITGGAGFIGSNFINKFTPKYADYTIVCVDLLTYASNDSYKSFKSQFKNFEFYKEDIRNFDAIDQLFVKHSISDVIHFAAESHVDNSISSPDNFISTNINGTFQLLKSCLKNWDLKDNVNRFVHVSTDEVYGSLGNNGFFTEDSKYAPNSPYSASKAASDFIVRSYHHTYGLNTVITNCSNNYGPFQHDEKLIPTIIRNAINNNPIPIYGNGQNIRDWLFVEDHCDALDLVFHSGVSGETYLIGGNNEENNLNLALSICEILDKRYPSTNQKSYKELISFVTDRKGHDYRYAIDSSKISNELKWSPKVSLEEGMLNTVNWYINKYTK